MVCLLRFLVGKAYVFKTARNSGFDWNERDVWCKVNEEMAELKVRLTI